MITGLTILPTVLHTRLLDPGFISFTPILICTAIFICLTLFTRAIQKCENFRWNLKNAVSSQILFINWITVGMMRISPDIFMTNLHNRNIDLRLRTASRYESVKYIYFSRNYFIVNYLTILQSGRKKLERLNLQVKIILPITVTNCLYLCSK